MSQELRWVVESVNSDGTLTIVLDMNLPPPTFGVRQRVLSATTALDPACVPSNPCGCYGCATCNPSVTPQAAPHWAAPPTTPAFGSPVAVSACTCGSATCNNCRAQRGMGPSGVTPTRGNAKPGGPAPRKASVEKGYRVVAYGDWLNREDGTVPGDLFSTPDIATMRARKGAKASKETFLVMRDGVRWKLLKADGDEVVIG